MSRLLKTLSILGLIMIAGCFPFPTGTDMPLTEMPDLTVPANTSTYTGKAGLIGTLSGTLNEKLASSITFETYDPAKTDIPVFIAADTVGTLTASQAEGIVAAFNAGRPIVLINATAEQITALYQALAAQDFTFTMPDGFTTVEIYALDKEPQGDIVQWVQYPPAASLADPDSQADRQTRVGYFIDWLKNDGTRMDSVEARTAKANAKGAVNNDLTQLAAAFVDQSNFSQWGNNYQIVHYVYGCHSIDTNNDWFYVQQQCVLYAGGAYTGKKNWYGGKPSDSVSWYMDTVELDSYMKGYDNNPSAVGMALSSPDTANNAESVTSGISFTIGGKVSVAPTGPSAEISGGVTISNTRTISVKDCDPINKSNDRLNNAHWLYQFKRCNTVPYFLYAGVTDPPYLAVNTFQPLNQWVWRMNPELRQKNVPMHVKLKVGLVGTVGAVDFYWLSHPVQTPLDGGTWEYNVNIPYPGMK